MGQPALVGLVQSNLNPKGILNIIWVNDFLDEFSFAVKSQDEAETLQKRIAQFIGEEYTHCVSCTELETLGVVEVILNIEGKEQFFKRLKL